MILLRNTKKEVCHQGKEKVVQRNELSYSTAEEVEEDQKDKGGEENEIIYQNKSKKSGKKLSIFLLNGISQRFGENFKRFI